MRITRKILEAKVATVNGLLGFDVDALQYNTVGSVQLYGAYGATAVHRVVNEAHGITDLSGFGTMKETAAFLSGMITGLRK
jgi:hypothetical protein